VSTSISIPPSSVGGGDLGGTEGGATRGGQSIGSGINQGRAKHVGVKVIKRSIDWKASFANCAWLILQAAAYQASRLVSVGRPKSIVAI